MDTFGRYEHFPDPVTLAIATLGVTAAGTGYGIYSAEKQKKIKPPKLPAPEAIPQPQPLAAQMEAEDIGRRRGYLQSFYAGSLSPRTGKWNRLGGYGTP